MNDQPTVVNFGPEDARINLKSHHAKSRGRNSAGLFVRKGSIPQSEQSTSQPTQPIVSPTTKDRLRKEAYQKRKQRSRVPRSALDPFIVRQGYENLVTINPTQFSYDKLHRFEHSATSLSTNDDSPDWNPDPNFDLPPTNEETNKPFAEFHLRSPTPEHQHTARNLSRINYKIQAADGWRKLLYDEKKKFIKSFCFAEARIASQNLVEMENELVCCEAPDWSSREILCVTFNCMSISCQ
jgi:hypothetical protein